MLDYLYESQICLNEISFLNASLRTFMSFSRLSAAISISSFGSNLSISCIKSGLSVDLLLVFDLNMLF